MEQHIQIENFTSLYNYIIANNECKIKNSYFNEQYYIDFMNSQKSNYEFQNKYKNFIEHYQTKIQLLNLNLEWIYYCTYVILYCDDINTLNYTYYQIINIIDEHFIKNYKINAIEQTMIQCLNNPNIIKNNWTEEEICILIKLLIKYDFENYFENILIEIKKIKNNFYDIVIYCIVEELSFDIQQLNYKKYFDIIKKYDNDITSVVHVGIFDLFVKYNNYPNQLVLQMIYNNNLYSCVLDDKCFLKELVRDFSLVDKHKYQCSKIEIVFSYNKFIKLKIDNSYNLILLTSNLNFCDDK